MKNEIQQLQSLVTIVMEMIRKDYPDTTSVCSKDSMNLGEFKKRVKLTNQDISAIKLNQPVSNELIKLELFWNKIIHLTISATDKHTH